MRLFCLLFLMLFLSQAASAARYALVIGNADYAAVADLHNPKEDATDMALELKNLNFEVTRLVNADKPAMDKALEAFIGTLRRTDEAVVYFSGHGVQYRNANYLVPTDAKPKTGADIPYSMVNAQQILDNLQEVNGDGVNLLILDACRNSPFKSLSKSAAQGLANMKPSGSLVLYATAPGTEAMGSEGLRNSIYTHHLLAALRNPAQHRVSILDMQTGIAAAVKRDSGGAQLPWQEGSLTQTFCFAPPCGGAGNQDEIEKLHREKLALQTELEAARQQQTSEYKKEQIRRYNETYYEPLDADSVNINNFDLWIYAEHEGGTYSSGLDNKIYFNPPSSFFIEKIKEPTATKDGGGLSNTIRISKYKGQTVRFSAFIKTENVKNKAWIYAQSGNLYPSKGINGNNDWTELVLIFHIPKDHNKEYITLAFSLWEGGRMWIDNIRWEVVEGSVISAPTATQTATSTAMRGETLTDLLSGIKFIWLEGGCFKMGKENGEKDEKPVHEVCVDGFYLAETETTQAQWEAVMGNNPSLFKGANRPVEQVSWNDTQEFIQKLGNSCYRLPTEAEWEYAARAGSNGDYSLDKDGKEVTKSNLNDYAWYGYEKADKQTHEVATKQPNKFGLYDMHGNVWEWTNDWYESNYYDISPRNNPQGAKSGEWHLLRGCTWSDSSDDCRATNRQHPLPSWLAPDNPNYGFGFRLAQPCRLKSG